jgi:hypothetical protein
MKLYEVFLATGHSASEIMSQEVMNETGAQVFTAQEAALVGLEGIPDDPLGRPRIFIACAPADAQFIATRLEASAAVASFSLHDL